MDFLNTNESVKGQVILDFIDTRDTLEGLDKEVADELYFKYIVDPDGQPKRHIKIYPDVYYYVNRNNRMQPAIYAVYIVRDQLKSPRHVSKEVAEKNLVDTNESYMGREIKEWAYFQNGSAENPFYVQGCDLVTKYFENQYPLRPSVYYFINNTSNGLKVFRDTSKSPRMRE